MNWGGFAGGFAQGFNQAGIAKYLLSDRYKEDRAQGIIADTVADEKAKYAAESQTTPSQPAPNSSETNVNAAPAPAKTDAAVVTPTEVPETQKTTTPAGAGIKAVVASEGAPATPQATETPVEPPMSPQPMSQQGNALAGGITGAKPAAQQEQQTKKKPANVEDFILSTALPNARNKLIAEGHLDAAERLDKHIESAKGKEAMSLYGKAYNALTYGNDTNKAVQLFGDYYNKFIDDGVDFTKGEITKDGQIAITTKRKEDGAENVLTMSRGQLLRMGMAYNPVKLYEMNLSEAVDAEKSSAKNRAEIAKEDRQQGHKIELVTIEKQLDAANVAGKERRQLDSKIGALRSAGYSDEFINGALPGLLGIGDYKKSTSPEEARRLAHSDRMKNDPMYARKKPEDQSKTLDQDMNIIYAGGKPTNVPAAPASPAAGGLPKAGGKTPVYDTKTGTIVYR